MAVSVELRTTCPKCGNPVPVNGLVPEVLCPSCEHVLLLSAELWHEALSGLAAVATGSSTGGQTLLGVGTTLTQESSAPRCAECGAELAVEGILAPEEPAWIDCTCGARVAVRKLPRDLVPHAASFITLLIGEDPSQLSMPAPGSVTAASEPVFFPCPHCGGTLPIDGSARIVKCSYCCTNAYLPDDLWRRIHPVKTVARWYAWVDAALLGEHGAREQAEAERVRGVEEVKRRASTWSTVAGFGVVAILCGLVISLDTCLPRQEQARESGPVTVALLTIGYVATVVGMLASARIKKAVQSSQQQAASESENTGFLWLLAVVVALVLAWVLHRSGRSS
ncbi:Hypothetical protein A7982_02712 [Minicystis rosea]|nr:Hypothetical protein A7982_02712 [Minicystis rosea]